MPLPKIISGGQTGADQGGLLGARDAGAPTGGTAPKGWRTEAGPAPWLAELGLVEGEKGNYTARTRANVEAADATVIFGTMLSPGSALTERHALELGRPVLRVRFGACGEDVEAEAERLAEWVRSQGIRTLNVAGNRESVNPGIGAFVRAVVRKALALVRERDAT